MKQVQTGQPEMLYVCLSAHLSFTSEDEPLPGSSFSFSLFQKNKLSNKSSSLKNIESKLSPPTMQGNRCHSYLLYLRQKKPHRCVSTHFIKPDRHYFEVIQFDIGEAPCQGKGIYLFVASHLLFLLKLSPRAPIYSQ